MKITAKPVDQKVMELHCEPFFGKPYIIYAIQNVEVETNRIVWHTQSGRFLNAKEKAAIERVPIKAKGSKET